MILSSTQVNSLSMQDLKYMKCSLWVIIILENTLKILFWINKVKTSECEPFLAFIPQEIQELAQGFFNKRNWWKVTKDKELVSHSDFWWHNSTESIIKTLPVSNNW